MADGTESLPAPRDSGFQVGEWTVEPALNQLTAAGKTAKLEPKTMAVLVYLAERPGQVVSREALLSGVWSRSVVGDDSVTQVVLKLRKALGDVREKPAYIQTISKGGYRLIAPVVRSQDIAGVPGAPHSASPPKRNRHVPGLAITVVAGLLLAAAGVWWFESVSVLPPDRVRAVSTAGARAVARPTITVKLFEALGDDARALLLAEGMTADLVTDLSKVSGLSVISVEAPRSRPAAPQAAPIPIGYIVSGSVQRIGDRLRLNVHLNDAETGTQLWSERFDRALSGFFTIQEELGPKILQILPTKVSEAEMRRVAQPHTRNLEAYEYFQRGQSALRVRQKAENEIGREMFRRAIALDATFARAYAGLARTYAVDYRNQWTGDDPASLNRAFELARTALEMNPDVPETEWVLAYVYMQRREHKQALQHLETAVRGSPSFADGYALMGTVNTYVGNPAQAVGLVRTAMRLNPEGNILYFITLGQAYLFLGDLEQARVNLEQALSRNPAYLELHVYLAVLHLLVGDKAAAVWEAEEIRTLKPDFSSGRWLETYPMTDTAQKTKLVHALAKLGF